MAAWRLYEISLLVWRDISFDTSAEKSQRQAFSYRAAKSLDFVTEDGLQTLGTNPGEWASHLHIATHPFISSNMWHLCKDYGTEKKSKGYYEYHPVSHSSSSLTSLSCLISSSSSLSSSSLTSSSSSSSSSSSLFSPEGAVRPVPGSSLFQALTIVV